MRQSILFSILFGILGVHVLAQNIAAADSTITIGIRQSPPFVNVQPTVGPDGLSLDFWSEVEGQAQVIYEYREFESLTGLLEALEAGEVDMSINPITVTEERMKKLDYSQPFYISGTTLVRIDNSNWWGVLSNIFSWNFLKATGLLLAVIFIFGFLMWLFERKKNAEMFANNAQGLGDGFWWSAVTMTTVGYGDKAPVTRAGRFLGFIWMFAAILLISGLTASIASALTVSTLEAEVNSAEDLRKFNVGTIQGSSSSEYMDIFSVGYNEFSSVEDGLRAVENEQIDMFVYDRPILKYYLNQMELEGLVLSKKDLKTDYYSFSFPKGSKLRDYLDPFVVKALKSERWNYRLRSEEVEN